MSDIAHKDSQWESSQQSLGLVICGIFCLALSDRGMKAWQLHKIDQVVMLLGDPVKSLS
jgi:hypothetical protein